MMRSALRSRVLLLSPALDGAITKNGGGDIRERKVVLRTLL